MTEVFDTKDLVSELVPHKGKMLLLDRVRDYDLKENSITTEMGRCNSLATRTTSFAVGRLMIFFFFFFFLVRRSLC